VFLSPFFAGLGLCWVVSAGTWPTPYSADNAKLSSQAHWDESFASSAEYGVGHVPRGIWCGPCSDSVFPKSAHGLASIYAWR
jgi:hypothetical protein